MGIHLGLHWAFIKGIAARHSVLPAKAAFAAGVILLVAALGWGGYSLATGSFSRWISEPFATASVQFSGDAPEERGEHALHDGAPDAFAGGETRGEGRGKGGGEGKGWGNGAGKGRGMGAGKNVSMNQDVHILSILSVIATYASEMSVFAFLTVLISGGMRRKDRQGVTAQ